MSAVEFPPERGRGVPVHVSLILLLAGITAVCSWQASIRPIGLPFTLLVIAAALAFLPLPLLVYRLWALLRAHYTLDRDSLVITWGLRVERIPISDIEWVRSLPALKTRLHLPALYLPGSLLGTRKSPDLGTVEFLASDRRTLLLLATRKRLLAISPTDPQGFLQNIQRAIEMGSLTPAQPQSVYPGFILSQAWESRLARYLWLTAILLNLGLFIWVSLLASSLTRVPLGFLPTGEPGETVPAIGLILLPIISSVIAAAGWVGGLVFYRRPEQRPMAFILWGSNLLAGVLFLLALLFLITTPV